MLVLTLRETYALNRLSSFKNLRQKGGKFDHRPGRPRSCYATEERGKGWKEGGHSLICGIDATGGRGGTPSGSCQKGGALYSTLFAKRDGST